MLECRAFSSTLKEPVMSAAVSLRAEELAVPAREELLSRVESAFHQRGVKVDVPLEAVKCSSGSLSSDTTEEILRIRRAERSISSETLAFSFA